MLPSWLLLIATSFFLPTVFGWSGAEGAGGSDGAISLRFLHRYSSELSDKQFFEDVHLLSSSSSTGEVLYNLLEQSSSFYNLLHQQDRVQLQLAKSANQTLSFSSGNETMDYGNVFGWLHYAVIDIGTPNVSFLVALDTGSDLLWVPCNCKQCASTSDYSKFLGMPLNTYNPYTSNSSKPVTCGSNLCQTPSQCMNITVDCPYSVQYISDNTATSGILYEDVIHLTSGTHSNNSVDIQIVFGCGQVQSGDFLNGGAPDGLLGLGFGEISLPSLLAEKGLIRNSFSMCFQADGSGRIFFGDRGSALQQKTPFISAGGTHVPYVVALDQISVGTKKIIEKGLSIIIDSGTSFTYLPMDVYSSLTTEFDKQIQLETAVFPDIPWQFCYEPGNKNATHPAISMVFQGGGKFSVLTPLISVVAENGTRVGFCLAVFASDNVAILGQNFMTGYSLIFDREDMQFGWSSSDCYNLEDTSQTSSVPVPSSGVPSAKSTSLAAPAPSNSKSTAKVPSTSSGFQHIVPLYSLVLFLVLNHHICSTLWK